MANDTFWQTKVHARLHDPAEKALVLLRDPAGHEGGTSRTLHHMLFKEGISQATARDVKRADWWVSAADRPQWPREGRFADQVRWTQQPTLIHPLTGQEFDLRSLAETDIGDVKERSLQHLRRFVVRDDTGNMEWRKTLCALWRFGSELSGEGEDHRKLGLLWPLLPADTRVPDHSIWDHLDLTSAFAGAFAADADGEPALLALAIGPVQSFIAAARTTSDLWAGSHLLARLSWEAMKVVCEKLGPDTILFPRLRGVPMVDLWLRDEIDLQSDSFQHYEWTKSATDANPLFAAALPNRFVAVVPKDHAENLASEITRRVRCWLKELGHKTVDRLLDKTDFSNGGERHCHSQAQKQLAGFPEVHWASIPFSLIHPRDRDRQTDLDTAKLSEAMAPFFGAEPGQCCGFLATDAWKVLQREVQLDGATFYVPTPGVLYPAVHDLAERVLAAAKAVRPFEQITQIGWRCSLTGESEWLTTDPEQLRYSYRRQKDTLWTKVADREPGWVKVGEHLGALSAVKRLWPTLFAETVAHAVGETGAADRFVVSTHTMAWAGSLERLDAQLRKYAPDVLEGLVRKDDAAPALPRGLAHLRDSMAARIPAAMDRLREASETRNEAARDLRKLESKVTKLLGHRPETYYALLLMDGDRMGAILSGDDPKHAIRYRESFHPQMRLAFDGHAANNPAIRSYGNQQRAPSPGRHSAISGALNDFAIHVVPHVVEREFHGKLIYAGGDDVLAMLPVAALLPAMQRLRHVYSGSGADDVDWRSARDSRNLMCKGGFAYLRGRLMRMMGECATASCGAVVAHCQTPLAAVLRKLRETEQHAKNEGGRDAFSISLVKRSGGTLHLTCKWGEAMDLLVRTRKFLSEHEVSRRAAYHCVSWLRDLPDDVEQSMLESLLAYVFGRQSSRSKTSQDYHDVPGLARDVAKLATEQPAERGRRRRWTENFLSAAEFLARETRSDTSATPAEERP